MPFLLILHTFCQFDFALAFRVDAGPKLCNAYPAHVEFVYICFIQTLSKMATKGVSSTDMYVNAPITSDPGKDIQSMEVCHIELGLFSYVIQKKYTESNELQRSVI